MTVATAAAPLPAPSTNPDGVQLGNTGVYLLPGYGTLDQDALKELADMGATRLKRYQSFGAYYDGEHNINLTERQQALLNDHGLGFADNFCDSVVDAKAQRLKITSWLTPGIDGDTNQETLAQFLKTVWRASRMDDKHGTCHTQTLMKGDSFFMLGWNSARRLPSFIFHQPNAIKPVYSEEEPDTMDCAVKRWQSSSVAVTNPNGRPLKRMNVYYPDRIEKYYSPVNDDDGRWYIHIDGGDATWPLPWVDGAGAPLGIPVVHFRNKPMGGTYGRSELAKVLPMQDLLNKWMLDLDIVMDEQGFAQRWAAGLAEGEAIPSGAGITWETSNENAKFGQFDPANPQGLLAAIEACLQHISGSTSTPMHLLMMRGDAPSGESLMSAESGLVAAIEEKQPGLGDSWEDLMRMAVRINNAHPESRSQVPETDDMGIEPVWKDAESRNEKLALDVEEGKVRLGQSKRTALRNLGVENVDEELAQAAAEADQDAQRRAADFNRGGLGL